MKLEGQGEQETQTPERNLMKWLCMGQEGIRFQQRDTKMFSVKFRTLFSRRALISATFQ